MYSCVLFCFFLRSHVAAVRNCASIVSIGRAWSGCAVQPEASEGFFFIIIISKHAEAWLCL